jgi:predicted transglutaminase-like cysteine proteinase
MKSGLWRRWRATATTMPSRHDLLQMGWPSSSLRLAEVTLNTGEHHLILVADIEGEPFILDNLDPDVLSLALTQSGYYWNRISR